MMTQQHHLQGRVCGADFGGENPCTDCGTDLSKLMEIAAKSMRLRQQARQALRQRQYRRAYRLSAQAQDLHQSSSGQKLLYTAQLMDTIRLTTH